MVTWGDLETRDGRRDPGDNDSEDECRGSSHFRFEWARSLSADFERSGELDRQSSSMVDDLEDAGRGDAINPLKVSEPTTAFVLANLEEEKDDGDDEEDPEEERWGMREFVDNSNYVSPERTRRLSTQSVMSVATDAESLPEDIDDQQQPCEFSRETFRQMSVNVLGAVFLFFMMCVIYISAASSIFGSLDPSLSFGAIDTMLAGSTIVGAWFTCLSTVPWASPVMDVAFVPFLAQLAQVCWLHVVLKSDARHTDVDATHYQRSLRGKFLITYVVAQAGFFVLLGLTLTVLGTLKLVKLVVYLPYTVTAGLLAATGVSLVKRGTAVAACGGFEQSPLLGWTWLGLSVFYAFASLCLKQSRRLPAHLVMPSLVAVSSALVFGAAAVCGVSFDDLREVGALFPPTDDEVGWWAYAASDDRGYLLARVDWNAVFECRNVVFAAVFLGTLNVGIKCGAYTSMFPAENISPDFEAKLAGVASLVGAAFLTSGQVHSFPGIKTQQRLAASRKGAAYVLPVLCAIVWLVSGVKSFAAVVPRFVFGGLLVELGMDLVETFLVYPLLQRKGFEALDIATMLVIVLTAVLMSLLEAVGIGLAIALLASSRRLAQNKVVQSTASGKRLRSSIERNTIDLRLLEKRADAIYVITLSGYVFFGSANQIVDAVMLRARRLKGRARLRYLVLDVEQCVPTFDPTALAAFSKLLVLAAAKGFEVHVAPRDSPACRVLERDLGDVLFFESVDDALEHAEDALLLLSPHSKNLGESTEDLVREWLRCAAAEPSDELVDALAKFATANVVPAGTYNRQGKLSLVVSGRFRLVDDEGHLVRKLAPGAAVGLGDFYTQQAAASLRMSASVRAIVLEFAYADIQQFNATQPQLALHFHLIMAKTLALKNRASRLSKHSQPRRAPLSLRGHSHDSDLFRSDLFV